MKKIVIAIDGYSGCGKSTTAKNVAAQIGYAYIDTGAMYRATTLYFLKNDVDVTSDKQVEKALSNINITFKHNDATNSSITFLNGEDVEEEIRKMYISEKVSPVSTLVRVRRAMVAQQKKMGEGKGIVMDGRDIGTQVFPNAELKIFMNADVMERARRRQKELLAKNQKIELSQIVANLEKRDLIDSTREEGPLKKADDAIELDTSSITINEQVSFVVEKFQERIRRIK